MGQLLGRVEFPTRRAFGEWTADAIKALVGRLEALRDRAGRSDSLLLWKLPRREFLTTFSDDASALDGVFLELPVAVFNALDDRKSRSVCVAGPLILLHVLGQGSEDGRLRALFRLLTHGQKYEGMAISTLANAVELVVRVLFDLGAVSRRPQAATRAAARAAGGGRGRRASIPFLDGGEAESFEVAAAVFAGAGLRDTSVLSEGQFVDWLASSQAFLDVVVRFKLARPVYDAMRQSGKLHGIVEEVGVVLKEAARAEARDEAKEKPRGIALLRQRRQEKLLAAQRAKKGGSRPDSATAAPPSGEPSGSRYKTSAELRLAEQEFRRKQAIQRATNLAELERAVVVTGFTMRELRTVREKFARYADRHGYLDRKGFSLVMLEAFPALALDGSIEKLFDAFDNDQSERIDFRELCHGLSTVVLGNVDDKIELFFSLFDADGNGELERSEILRFLESGSDRRFHLATGASELVNTFTGEVPDFVTAREFVNLAASHPALMQTIQEWMQAVLANGRIAELQGAVRETQRALAVLSPPWTFRAWWRVCCGEVYGSFHFPEFGRDLGHATVSVATALAASGAPTGPWKDTLEDLAVSVSSARWDDLVVREDLLVPRMLSSVSFSVPGEGVKLVSVPVGWPLCVPGRPSTSGLFAKVWSVMLRLSGATGTGAVAGEEEPGSPLASSPPPSAWERLRAQWSVAVDHEEVREDVSVFRLVGTVLASHPAEKALLFFRCHDPAGRGVVRTSALAGSILTAHASADHALQSACRLLAQLDQNRDGVVALDEFRSAVRLHPPLLSVVASLLGTQLLDAEDAAALRERAHRVVAGDPSEVVRDLLGGLAVAAEEPKRPRRAKATILGSKSARGVETTSAFLSSLVSPDGGAPSTVAEHPSAVTTGALRAPAGPQVLSRPASGRARDPPLLERKPTEERFDAVVGIEALGLGGLSAERRSNLSSRWDRFGHEPFDSSHSLLGSFSLSRAPSDSAEDSTVARRTDLDRSFPRTVTFQPRSPPRRSASPGMRGSPLPDPDWLRVRAMDMVARAKAVAESVRVHRRRVGDDLASLLRSESELEAAASRRARSMAQARQAALASDEADATLRSLGAARGAAWRVLLDTQRPLRSPRDASPGRVDAPTFPRAGSPRSGPSRASLRPSGTRPASALPYVRRR